LRKAVVWNLGYKKNYQLGNS